MAAGNGTNKERDFYGRIMVAAIIMVSLGLAGLSISGAWLLSNKNIAYTGLIFGFELVALSALTMIVFAANKIRRIAGWAIFIATVTVCVINAERAIKNSFGLDGSAATMRIEADLLDEKAERQTVASATAEVDAKAEQKRLREEVAALNLELDLMTSQTRVKEAQSRLKALGLYTGAIDGLREELTEQAMLARGESIRKEMALLKQQMEDPADVEVSGTADGMRLQAAELRDKANKVDGSDVWVRATLVAAELIRSFAVWAFLLKSEITNVRKEGGDAETEPERETETASPQEPQARDETPPEDDNPPEDESEPDEPSDKTAWSRKGGKAAQAKRRAEAVDDRIPVDDRNEYFAAREAAQ